MGFCLINRNKSYQIKTALILLLHKIKFSYGNNTVNNGRF